MQRSKGYRKAAEQIDASKVYEPLDAIKLAKDQKAVAVDFKFLDFLGTWQHFTTPVSELETLEGLEQLRFLAAGVPMAVVDVETPPFTLRELNNPEDVAPIEQALAEAGLE